MQKSNVNGQLFLKTEWKQTGIQTDRGDCITYHANAVGNQITSIKLHGFVYDSSNVFTLRGAFPDTKSTASQHKIKMQYRKEKTKTTKYQPDFIVSSSIPSTYLSVWARGLAGRRHTCKHGSSSPRQHITQSTSWLHVATPTWPTSKQVYRPA